MRWPALLAVIAGVAAALGGWAGEQPKPDAAVRGVALGLFASEAGYDYRPMLDEIAARGATDVLVVVPWHQSGVDGTSITPMAGRSPSDETVERTLAEARARGLRPAVMPIVRLSERVAGQWRGVIAPSDVDGWFLSYGRFVERMAALAEAGGAARLYVGSELSSMERYTHRWLGLIAGVRARFAGRLSYSANWDHTGEVRFWGALDEIGVTGYFPMPDDSVDAVAAAWAGPRDAIAALGARHGKPVVLSEVGYASRASAAARPWDDGGTAAVDLGLQARLYEGFCAAWAEAGVAQGVYAWNWFGVGGPRDAGFSLRGKPAAGVVGRCLRRWRAREPSGV